MHYPPIGVTEGQWKTYRYFLSLLKEGIDKIETSITTHKNQMYLFQKLIRESMDKAYIGLTDEEKLKNLWDRLRIPKPISPFADYRRATDGDGFTHKWRTHEIDHSSKRSLFWNMERIRLLSSHISTQINLETLSHKGFVVAHFPLPNSRQLKGRIERKLTNATTEDVLLRNILIDFKSASKGCALIESWNT